MAIHWMQRHKKWLIVTIWISTIAFVGAGFVGWGSYNYGKSEGTVAVVGDKEIPLSDLQNEYSSLYSQYQNMFGGKFNQEMAKQLGLEQAAMQKVIHKYLFLNYAEDLGLMTTDKEIAEELVKIKAFQKDGKFDKNTYLQVLKQNRRTAADFEKQLKQDLLVNKIQTIFALSPEKKELENLGNIIFAKSKVSIKVIDGEDIKITPTMEELQKFYENHKNEYKSQAGYEIAINKIENQQDMDKKAMKKVALREYLGLKKDEIKFDETKAIYDLTTLFDKENLEVFNKANEGDILKPFYKDENYYVVKKIKNIQPQTLPFEDVKSQINKAYILAEKEKTLEKKGETAVTNFSGENIGYIDRNSELNIKGLSLEENKALSQSIFNSSKIINYINLKDKVVVYKIEDTKLGKIDDEKSNLVLSTIQNYKSNAIASELLEQLQNRYSIKSYLAE
jgi:peptidyl-prolyl cis-trans isomerase D